ncbi:MAG: N-acetyltransferase family protein [Rhizobiaceae bacterium]
MTRRAASTRVEIRQAVAADADRIHGALLDLGDHVGEQHKIKSTPADIRRYGFGTDARFHTLIAEGNGIFAGICIYFPSFSTWLGVPGVYIQDIVVDRDFRGQGIGERLLREVARLTHAEGARYMRLAVDVENLSAQAFYDRLGFQLVKDDMIRAAYGEAFAALVKGEDE